MTIRKYTENDLPDMIAVWNEVVREGTAFTYFTRTTSGAADISATRATPCPQSSADGISEKRL